MTTSALFERRRALRSSSHIRYFLFCCLVVGVLVAWRMPSTSAALERRSMDNTQAILQQYVADAREGWRDDNIGSLHAPLPLRVVTYNVRYATQSPDAGEKLWKVRAPKLGTQLQFITAGHDNAFLCLQECLHEQVVEIGERLGSAWAFVGRGRDTKETDGEYSPIFYQPETWECERWDTRWLSKTPTKPSRGWDAVLNRIATIGVFRHRATDTRVVVIATHFDHVGHVARKHSAELLIQFAQEWRDEYNPSAVFIGGDFNSPPGDGAYQAMVAEGSGMSDVHALVGKGKRYGNDLTYTGFGKETRERIDFLFVQEPRSVQVKTFGTLANVFDDGVMISDHRPVVADFVLPV